MAFKFNALSGKFDIVDGAGISQATADTRYLQLSGGTMTGAINSLSVIPTVDSASDLGSSSKYFANEYVDKIYLNGTAYLDGASAGVVTVSDGLTVTGTITTNTSGNIKATGGFVYARGIFDESTTTAGIYMGYGPSNDSPRFLLANGTASQNFQIDNNAGTMRFFSPSNVIMQLSTTNIIANKPISTPSNTNLSLVPNGTGYTIIGDAGTTSHSFNTNDDLLVSGRLEVNGITYLDGVTTVSGVIASDTDSTDDLGTSSIYFANTYTDKIFLNATATLAGATGGQIDLVGNLYGSTTSIIRTLDLHAYGANASIKLTNTNDGTSTQGFMQSTYNSMQFGYIGLSGANQTGLFLGRINGTGKTHMASIHKADITSTSDLGNILDDGDNNMTIKGNLTIADAKNIVLNTTTGTKIGTATTQKLAFYNATPIVQVVDARIDDAISSGDATTDGVIDAIRDALISYGLIAAA